MNISRVAVMGAGAVGSYPIWGISRCKDVELSLVASGERAVRLKTNGVVVNGESYRPQILTPSEAHNVDLLIVCLKYGALSGALESIRQVVGPNTTVMSLMNGVESEGLIAEAVGESHVLPALIKIASSRQGQGFAFDPETTKGIVFGEREAPFKSKRVKAIEALFAEAGLRFRSTEFINEEIWSKFRLNVCNNLPQAILGVGVGCYTSSKHVAAIRSGLEAELMAIAKAKGIDLSKADSSSGTGSAVPPTARYSTLQDLDAGRHTEVDMFSGALIRMGRELGIPTPFNEYTFHMIKALEEKNDGLFNFKDNAKATCSE